MFFENVDLTVEKATTAEPLNELPRRGVTLNNLNMNMNMGTGMGMNMGMGMNSNASGSGSGGAERHRETLPELSRRGFSRMDQLVRERREALMAGLGFNLGMANLGIGQNSGFGVPNAMTMYGYQAATSPLGRGSVTLTSSGNGATGGAGVGVDGNGVRGVTGGSMMLVVPPERIAVRVFGRAQVWGDYFNNMKKCWEPLLDRLQIVTLYEKVRLEEI
jgi:hypothetical protein